MDKGYIKLKNMKPCPFCGQRAVMHITEFHEEYLRHDDAVPKGARIVREWRRPGSDGWTKEIRRRAFVPQCSDTACIGRVRKLYESEADAIAAWNKRADSGAEAVTIGGWRSFPNEKPPENVTVWIWTDGRDYPAKGYYSHGSWYYTMTGCMAYDGTVTHWMPIPPPPTKPKEGKAV